ncbi:connector enhancer of kinase suppressor of ras 1 isoform X2 [Strigops habroptila]|uniref:connector enhancer of kinase suppressor of ras 1 isoform X2 n=1 Tax=Strigops habroptila TaxID=2489341 RepID=UPI0011D01282|nr:connector enhancer of kinase suppressor of ras 1 isoform X2 [Strigops habroptila]
MESLGTWGPAQAAAWLRGLDGAVQGYPFETWGLAGPDLLGLSAGSLEALGVRRLGHQELLLEAVEQLCALDAGLASTSLRTLTERLRELAQGIQSLVLGGLPAGAAPRPPSLALLARVVDLVRAAKGLFSWLNRYLFSTLNDFSASQDIVLLCTQLAETLQADCPAAKRDSRILHICQHIVGICESIVGCSPPALLDRRAVLQRVVLQGSPPMSPDTLTLPPGLWGSPPASPDTLMLPSSPWGRPPTSPDTLTPPSEPLGSTPQLLTAPLGLKITSTTSCLHFVSATTSEALDAHRGLILPGDEIVQVNEQVVVGWTRVNLAKKLLENVSRVTLVLKKIPLDLPGSPQSPRQQVSDPSAPSTAPVPQGTRQGCLELGHLPSHWWSLKLWGPMAGRHLGLTLHPQLLEAFLDAADSTSSRSSECPGSPVSLTSSVAAADFDSGPDSALDPVTDEEAGEDKQNSRLTRVAVGELPELPSYGAAEEVAQESGSPLGTLHSLGTLAAELSPMAAPAEGAGGADPSQLPREGSPQAGRRPKGVATRLSRRRVSCRDLGRVDCDGWLLKKKDHVGFMAQKWKRCWFVLKGHTLYWYHHPNVSGTAGCPWGSCPQHRHGCWTQLPPLQDEKAAGLINVATYDLESTREQKKKYVFQLCHQRYKPFIFAAETLADLSMWVSHLITAKTKYTLAHQSVPDREEDCYSETEAEDPDDESPRHGCDLPRKRLQNAREKAQLLPASEPGSPQPCASVEPSGEDLECLIQCLKQGGVSLIGRQQVLTREQCHRSFIRRSKNPYINAKVHTVRALQSTLKAKLVELQALEQLLSDAALTSEKFTRWKEEHQELYQELQEWWAGRQRQDHDRELGAECGLPPEGAEP